MRGAYFAALVVSIGCLMLVDFRYKLAWFSARQRTLRVLLIAILFFCVWDIAGILLGIFFIGSENVLFGLKVGQFPLEELFFLYLLCYNALLLFRIFQRVTSTGESR